MNLKIDYLKSMWQHKPWARIYFLVLLFIPIPAALLVTTFFFRLPYIKHTQEERNVLSLLNSEIELMASTCTDEDMRVAGINWEQIRSKVPGSYEDVSYLIEDLIKFASSRGFAMNYTLGGLKPAYHEAVGFSLLPLNVKLMVQGINAKQARSGPVGLVQFIELLHEISKGYFGIDISDIMVTGTGDGIRAMDVNLNLWVGFDSEAT